MIPSVVAARERLFAPLLLIPLPLPPPPVWCSGVATGVVAELLRNDPPCRADDSTLRGDDLGEDGDFGDDPPLLRRTSRGEADAENDILEDILDDTPENSVEESDRDALRGGCCAGGSIKVSPLPDVAPCPCP